MEQRMQIPHSAPALFSPFCIDPQAHGGGDPRPPVPSCDCPRTPALTAYQSADAGAPSAALKRRLAESAAPGFRRETSRHCPCYPCGA
jgi:hypothetical protein